MKEFLSSARGKVVIGFAIVFVAALVVAHSCTF